MKQGKKLTRKLRKFLEDAGLDSKNYLVERQTIEKIGFINKETNKVEYFKLDGSRC